MYLASLVLIFLKFSKEINVTLPLLLHRIVDALRVLNQYLHRIILLLPDLLQYCCEFFEISASFINKLTFHLRHSLIVLISHSRRV